MVNIRKWTFDLPLDQVQREIAAEVLAREGAPFDPTDREEFALRVGRVWGLYQARLAQPILSQPRLARLGHRVDRLIYERKHDEYVDDGHIDERQRRRMMRGLDRLNRAALAYRWFARALDGFLRDLPDGEVSILDIGSGHGAFLVQLAKRRKQLSRPVRLVGSDISPAYVEQARKAARQAGVDVEFRPLDALELDRLDERFDVITSTQTLHHFEPPLLAGILASAVRNARRGVVFLDDRRSPMVLAGAVVGTVLVSRNPRLVHDGFYSVRRMYSPAEFELLARCAPGGEKLGATNMGYALVQLTGRTG